MNKKAPEIPENTAFPELKRDCYPNRVEGNQMPRMALITMFMSLKSTTPLPSTSQL